MTTTDNTYAAPAEQHTTTSPERIPSWGSDAVVDLLQRAGIDHITLNPGASFRGLHDSLVNYAGDAGPHMLLCLHEEHAVAIAHGWAKITGRPMAVALHSNVGLMHATMALYNAWCDRVPMLVIGATGPLDADRRRPWIDWIHTSSDQPALVRNFVKWDDTPTSLAASLESLARAWDITRTAPTAPTYVVLDTTVQEQALGTEPPQPLITAGRLRDQPTASAESLARAATLLSAAKRPVVLAGPAQRDEAAWANRIKLVEALGARVVTDLKAGSMFPTRHPAHIPGPGFFLGKQASEALRDADAILALNWIDLAGTLAQAGIAGTVPVVSATLEPLLANGWSKDHQGRIQPDVWLPAEPDSAVTALLEHLPTAPESAWKARSTAEATTRPGPINLSRLSTSLQEALTDIDTTLVRLPLGWDGDSWDFDHPLAFLGYDGGGGIGSGPGMTVGAALALQEQGRMPVAVLGDGDFLMGVQAIWTAVNQRIPALIVVANNRSYFNDEVHQEKVAHQRGRDASRKWIGQRIADPAPDLAGLARAQGAIGYGPVTDRSELADVLHAAVRDVQAGATVVVDVVVETGYTPAMAAALTRETE
ncbi:thiamine pyrophosphate-binding protein [Rhodococcus sp. NCIMB 12038]|uniref:thiamine pyrophosphate-binding protein n=1 Tax=Rhodococcus sp. NCIMB 12038 TaxID=933800 RepID=UPI000B3CB42B|nr:thiamine pyrophosphate-binding protein [Rhodococcus sp. NCIMB 12038]OUS91911.1 acetolactate synthase [Rhodococcus sp. NCIMB 12038]